MAEFTTTKLNADSHLLLDQPLLRLPHELARRNFKTCQRWTEREKDYILPNLKDTAQKAIANPNPKATLSSLDTMIARMQGLKRKLEMLQEEEQRVQTQSRKRILHLEDLYKIPSLADVKYDEWSRVRLNRLLVDYLLRMGYSESARQLAREKEIEDLVDLDVFVQCQRIADCLRRGETKDCLTWCGENRALFKRNDIPTLLHTLEFELRLQQFIELVRSQSPLKLHEATLHARKYLAPSSPTQLPSIKHAAGLLAIPPTTTAEPYASLYSPERWTYLSNLFLSTHHSLLALPPSPLLHIALSAGLSALKTPSCHCHYTASSTNPRSATTSVCPICSTELNELARPLPYAHHTKSHVENDPVILPNGRVYGRERLMVGSRGGVGGGVGEGKVRDPTTGEVYSESEIRKVFIS